MRTATARDRRFHNNGFRTITSDYVSWTAAAFVRNDMIPQDFLS